MPTNNTLIDFHPLLRLPVPVLVSMSDGGHEADSSASFDETFTNGDRIVLTGRDLDEGEALRHVRKAEAGASVLFVGTTRNEFEGGSEAD